MLIFLCLFLATAGDYMSVFEGSMAGSYENLSNTPTKHDREIQPEYFTSNEVFNQLSLQRLDFGSEYVYR